MAKFLIFLCAYIACVFAKPSSIVPLATAAFSAPLDAAYASTHIDIQHKYGAALFDATPAKLLASRPVDIPLAAPVAAPLAAASAKLEAFAPVAARLTYTNLPLDASYASNRFDINQRYGSALLPTAFAAPPAKIVASASVAAPLASPVAAPLPAAPAKIVAPAPVPVAAALAAPVSAPPAYSNLPLDAAYASSRLAISQRYSAALVPTPFVAAPAQLVTSASVRVPLASPVAASLPAAPAKIVAPAPVPVAAALAAPAAAPLAYTNLPLNAAYASSRLDINQRYSAALVPTRFVTAAAKLVATASVAAPLASPVAAPLPAAPAKIVAPAPVPVAAALAAPIAAPLAYTNFPLNAAYASSRLDINQRYATAFVPTGFVATPTKLVSPAPVVAPVYGPVAARFPAAPTKLVASAPVTAPFAYTNLPLDAVYASSRLGINQKYGAPIVPTTFAEAPAKLVAPSSPLAAPVKSALV